MMYILLRIRHFLVHLVAPFLMRCRWRGNKFCHVNTIEQCGSLLKRAALCFDDVDIAEARLSNKPTRVNDL